MPSFYIIFLFQLAFLHLLIHKHFLSDSQRLIIGYVYIVVYRINLTEQNTQVSFTATSTFSACTGSKLKSAVLSQSGGR